MNPGLPKRNLINDRGISLVLGGDYRYLCILNPFDKSVSIFDTIHGSNISAVQSSLVSVSLNSTKSFVHMAFNPIEQSMYVFASDGYQTINLNPINADFLTASTFISSSLQTTTNGGIIRFFAATGKFEIGNSISSLVPHASVNARRHIYQNSVAVNLGATNNEGSTGYLIFAKDLSSYRIITNSSGAAYFPKIGDRAMLSNNISQSIIEVDWFNGQQIRACNMSGAVFTFNWYYDPFAKKIYGIRNGAANSNFIEVVDYNSFTRIGRTAHVASSGLETINNGYTDAFTSPYNGLTYCLTGQGNTSNVINNIHVYDLKESNLSSMYKGVLIGGQRQISGAGANNTFNLIAFNGLRNDEYNN